MRPLAAILLAAAAAHGADAYTPLWLYQGTWKAQSKSETAPKTIANQCARMGQFFGCQQTVDGKPGALILFLPRDGAPGHYYTQAVNMEGRALGRGDLLIEGSRWTYSSQSVEDGKTTYYRTTNEFTGKNRIHFEVSDSSDGEHWRVTMSGDEQRTKR